MAGVVIYRRPISVEEAEQQFDLLFDEYFKDDFGFHAQGLCFASGSRSEREEDFKVILDGGSPGEEFDDVHIPDERQEPQQVAQREAISQVAQQLRTLGDQYTEQHGNNFTVANSTLTALFTEVTGLEYDTFQNTVESLTTTDRNTEDLVFMMRLGWNVVGRLGSARNKATNFFRRYIGSNYIGEMAQAGGAVQYVHP